MCNMGITPIYITAIIAIQSPLEFSFQYCRGNFKSLKPTPSHQFAHILLIFTRMNKYISFNNKLHKLLKNSY